MLLFCWTERGFSIGIYGVSVDGVTVSVSYFARRYWRSPNYRKEFAVYRLFCIKPASEKGECPSTTKITFDSLAHFFLAEILHVQKNRREPNCKGTLSAE